MKTTIFLISIFFFLSCQSQPDPQPKTFKFDTDSIGEVIYEKYGWREYYGQRDEFTRVIYDLAVDIHRLQELQEQNLEIHRNTLKTQEDILKTLNEHSKFDDAQLKINDMILQLFKIYHP